MDLSRHAGTPYVYLSTKGRKSGEPREIEIWFALAGGSLYLMAGGRHQAHWVRNIQAEPRVSLRLDGMTYRGRGRLVDAEAEEDARARELVLAKYRPGYDGDVGAWGRTALVVAIDLDEDESDGAKAASAPGRTGAPGEG